MRWWPLALALLLALVMGCRGRSALNPQEMAMDSLANMMRLRSYRLEMEMDGNFIGAMEFQAPGRYRFVTPASGPEGGVVETIWTVEYMYFRRCRAERDGCEEWQKQPPTPIPLGAPGSVSVYVPGWPLTLLELAQDLRVTGRQVIGKQQVVQLQGHLNHVRAFLENVRRLYTKLGHENMGQRCTQGPGGQRECQPITFQDLLDQQKQAIDHYEAHPATIRAWLGQDDGLLHQLELEIPPGPSGERQVTIKTRYVRFQGVEINIPPVFFAPPASPAPSR
ncbi:MAG: hypothetical protein RQ985_00970 [Dehalococcoidia bacterium]|nr:hypothetical protein [Dehalococcoidia bacterium]